MIIEEAKISFKLQITETFYDGFRGIIPNKKLLFNNTIVRDNKLPLQKTFNKEDQILISLEFKHEVEKDVITENKIEFYIAVYRTAVNGFYTREIKKGENPHKTIHFYQSRGMITSPALIRSPFEQGDIIKVTIEKW